MVGGDADTIAHLREDGPIPPLAVRRCAARKHRTLIRGYDASPESVDQMSDVAVTAGTAYRGW
jgi:hypothetical protein